MKKVPGIGLKGVEDSNQILQDLRELGTFPDNSGHY